MDDVRVANFVHALVFICLSESDLPKLQSFTICVWMQSSISWNFCTFYCYLYQNFETSLYVFFAHAYSWPLHRFCNLFYLFPLLFLACVPWHSLSSCNVVLTWSFAGFFTSCWRGQQIIQFIRKFVYIFIFPFKWYLENALASIVVCLQFWDWYSLAIFFNLLQ